MKKITTLFLIFALLLNQKTAFGVLGVGDVVTDPTHMAATIAGHSLTLEQVTESAINLYHEIGILEKSYDEMKELKDNFNKINSYLYNIQAIVDATEGLIELTQSTTDIYNKAQRSHVFELQELSWLLDDLTVSIKMGKYYVENIKTALENNKWRMTDKERKEEIEANKRKIEAEQERLRRILSDVEEQIRRRKERDFLLEQGLLSPIEAYVTSRSVSPNITLGMELEYLLANSTLPRQTDFDDAQTAAKKTSDLFATLKNLFFVLSAFVALIGAFRVYQKVQTGEDIGKSISIWGFSALLVFILGVIVELFLLR